MKSENPNKKSLLRANNLYSMRKLCLLLILGMILINIVGVSAVAPYVKIGKDNTVYNTIINNTVSNKSNFWDNLDTPSDITESKFWTNHSSWIVNTYGKWFYNMSDGNTEDLTWHYNMSVGVVGDGSYNATYNTWAYNQSDGFGIYNYNQSTSIWHYNMSDGNTEDTTYHYNMTTPFTSWLSGFVYNYNQTLEDTTWHYNMSISSIYLYNQTTPFTSWLSSFNYNYNQTIEDTTYHYNMSDGSYNSTYNTWAYNQTLEDTTWHYNMTITTWMYNMTTPFTTWLSGFVYNYNQTNTFNFTAPANSYTDSKIALNNQHTHALNNLTAGNLPINLNMTSNNITQINYVKFNKITGSCDLTINGSICSNATGTYIIG